MDQISHSDFVAGIKSKQLTYISHPTRRGAGEFRGAWHELSRRLWYIRAITYPVLIGLLLWRSTSWDVSGVPQKDMGALALGVFVAPVLIGEILLRIYLAKKVRHRLMSDAAFFSLAQSEGIIEVKRR